MSCGSRPLCTCINSNLLGVCVAESPRPRESMGEFSGGVVSEMFADSLVADERELFH